tara:strand:- start:159 stop:509 length:351 start_codon:yes stop_codon:yes gene_type:complete
MTTKQQALAALRPGEEWKWSGDEYSGLTWLDAAAKPSEADINNKKSALESAAPMEELRRQRDRKLAECDWRASSDLTLTDAWKNYRIALRNLPETSPSPTLDSNGVLGNVTWPTAP